MKTFQNRFPGLSKKLQAKPDEKVIFVKTRSGHPTCEYRGKILHSRFDPVREAEHLIDQEGNEEISLCIFFGFGLGYHVEAFIERYPQTKTLVIEPSSAFLLKCMSARPMERLFTRPTLRFSIDTQPESLPALLDNLPLLNIKIIKPRALYLKDESYYKKLDGVLQSYIARRNLNVNTLNRFGRLWVRNLIKNMGLMASPGVNHLEDMFSGIPSLVLASGPSLDRTLPLLPKLKRRLLIITVDTSLKVCLERGVEPDFIVVVDPQYWNTRHLDRIRIKKALLVSDSSTNPRVFRILNTPAFFGSSFFPLGRHFEAAVGEKGRMGAGGSVSTSAWDLARLLGTAPIYMAGLDLGFPARNTHFKGAFFETRFHILSRKLNPAETMSFAYLQQASPFSVRSNTDGSVLTDQRMLIYKWWFEEQMVIHAGNLTYNLSPDGVHIEGMPFSELDNLLEFPDRRREIDEKITQLQDLPKPPSNTLKSLTSAKMELIEELSRLVNLANEALAEMDMLSVKLKNGEDAGNSFKRLNLIDREILAAGSRKIVSFLFQTVINSVIQDDRWRHKQPMNTVLDKSKEIYREIRDAAAYHLRLFEQHLIRLKKS